MIRLYFLLLIGGIFSIQSCGVNYTIPENAPSTQLGKDIIILSSDDMKGREVGTEGEKKAAEYIASRYENIGLSVLPSMDNYYQVFEAYEKDPHANPHSDMPNHGIPVRGKNVVGFIDNGAPTTVVIGAHYDHLGMGTFGSLYQGPAEIHNGADDNSSGVAVIMYMAEKLQSKAYDDNNYVFIAFSGEEKGLWGSNYFVKNSPIDLSTVNYMINYDMVGRMENNKLAINGTGTSPVWKELDDVNKKFELVKTESGIGPSDHTSFYLADIPSIHFFTGQHEDYHRPSDDFDKINYDGCYEVAHYSLSLIEELNDEGKIAFTKTKDDSKERRSFKVTLGVIPDYMFNDKGMRIDGVKDGRTADKAGIVKGDVVVKMGDLEIADMMGYMEALGSFEEGQTIQVEVLRDGKKITKTVTFQ